VYEYEVIIEQINPCGGEEYARKQILEVEAQSPEHYVRADGRYPILEIQSLPNGSTRVITGDGMGYVIRYTFTQW